jgi:death on curing protein
VSEEFEYLGIEDLLGLAVALLGDPPPLRDLGRAAADSKRPRASAFGEDAYPDTWLKAAALSQSIVKNHTLIDGNKRLGWLATAVFLELNGVQATTAANDAVYDTVMKVAAGQLDVQEIAEALKNMIGDANG